MNRNNIFDGDSWYAIFARNSYGLLITREWVKYSDVMAKSLNLNSDKDLPYNVSNCGKYGELKKAFRDIQHAIRFKYGNNCIEEKGNNRCKYYKYVGNVDDPLADLRNAKVVNNLKKYWKFCQDSAGFFPQSWLDYYFLDCKDLLEIKEKDD